MMILNRLLEIVGIKNASDVRINPSTEETSSAMETLLTSLQTILTAIKDTTGIKKITDPITEVVDNEYDTLNNISTTYNDVTTTAVSQNIDCSKYRQVTLAYEIDKANTPTDILFEVEVSLDGTNYTKLMNWFLGDLRYDDTAVGSGIKEAVTFPIGCNNIRVRITCIGTTAANTFTVANSVIHMRN